MSKVLNKWNKTPLAGVFPAALAVGPNIYQPSIPRVALGIVGVAMTALTIAVSVILPAQMDTGSREARILASKSTAPAPAGLVTVTRIDVVASRDSSTFPERAGEATPQSGRLVKTTSPAVIRVSRADR